MGIKELDKQRVKQGVCRHCGGPVPCWSYFGDQRVGKRHTQNSHAKMQDETARATQDASAGMER